MDDEERYNAIRAEALERGHYKGGPVGNDTLLFKYIEKQAHEIGADTSNLQVTIIPEDSQKFAAYIAGNKLRIGKYFLSEASSLDNLEGQVKHEAEHTKLSGFVRMMQNLLAKMGITEPSRKEECRADFATSGKIKQVLAMEYKTDGGHVTDHPSSKDRVIALDTQLEIERQSGIKLKPDDVNFEPDCTFTITNPAKLGAISPTVLEKAKKWAQEVADKLDSERNEMQNINTAPRQSIPAPQRNNKIEH